MATTDQVRIWYHETVANHDDRGNPGYEPIARWDVGDTCIFLAFPSQSGGYYQEPVHIATAPAWRVYIALMEKHGVRMSSAGGVDHARNIGDTDWPSLHAYLCACDLPPNTYKPQGFIDEVEALRTNSGVQVFRNLDGDRMHDQINCSPDDLATGIVGWTEEGKPMSIHEHTPEAGKTHQWADEAWNDWVEFSGTNPDTRGWNFQREDMAWVFTRVIRPLVDRVTALEGRVLELEQAPPVGGISDGADVVLQGRIHIEQLAELEEQP